jgi:hypothetical protein
MAVSPAAGLSVSPQLLSQADAVAAVEILRTDYTATAADGPMYADARVIVVVKGTIPRAAPLKFGESGWCGPTHKAGDLRILFLKRVTSPVYFSAASWSTACRPGDRLDVFFSPDALPLLSVPQLRVFLEDMQTLAETPPRLKVTLAGRSQRNVVLLVGLINTDRQTLWLHPAKLVVTYDVGQVRYGKALQFSGGGGAGWTGILPTRGISGAVTIPARELGTQRRLALTVAHPALYFPHRSWAGAVTAEQVLLER